MIWVNVSPFPKGVFSGSKLVFGGVWELPRNYPSGLSNFSGLRFKVISQLVQDFVHQWITNTPLKMKGWFIQKSLNIENHWNSSFSPKGPWLWVPAGPTFSVWNIVQSNPWDLPRETFGTSIEGSWRYNRGAGPATGPHSCCIYPPVN